MEIVKAVLVSAAIVAVTAVIIWMLRPGPAGIPATGGIMNRQPRASWLVFAAVVVGVIACWYILRGSPRARRRAKVLLPIALVVVLLGAVGAGSGVAGRSPAPRRRTLGRTAASPPTPTAPPTTPTTPTTTKSTGTTGATTPSTNPATTAQPPTTPAR